jgi:hypothetical protein
MKSFLFVFIFIYIVVTVTNAQEKPVATGYFPAKDSVPGLDQIKSKNTFEDPQRLKTVENGSVFADVGFNKYDRYDYAVDGLGTLTIEILTLLDSRAAYSALTLLRKTGIQAGPPGDAFTQTQEKLCFAQKNIWVRIQGKGLPEDLIKTVSVTISNRIGLGKSKLPSVVLHLPKHGYDATSLRYFPDKKSFKSFSGTIAGTHPEFESDIEIAQAHYFLENKEGILSLVSFPTPQIADEYYEATGVMKSSAEGIKVYTKKTGSWVAILEGNFDPETAEKILKSIEFRYSIRWIYQKENKTKEVWGIPSGILQTVVTSIFVVVILICGSVFIGIGIAILRIKHKKRAQHKSLDGRDPTEMTRLRLR